VEDLAQPVTPKVEAPRGMHNGKLDEKGRIKLPAQFQAFLETFTEGKYFVTSTDRMTAQIYPMSVWREQEAKLTSGEIPPKIAKEVLFTANDLGNDQTMDSQGRITFNSELRAELEMDDQPLRLYSELGHIQILTKTVYEAQKQASKANAVSNRELAEGYGLK